MTIRNESDKDIDINKIDVAAEDQPVVWLRPSLRQATSR